jgi:hypothetical protein
MSKLNQIQNALLEIEGGKFQKLGDAYLHAKGYKQINSIGSLIGYDKVRPGTPDTFVPLPNGKFVFVEHTTEARDTLFPKLKEDLEKCFDIAKTGVDVGKIQEIVFCHVGTLYPGQISTLQEQCAKRGINFNQFGVTTISFDLYQDYPGLARDFLNIEVDSGQIVSIDDFIEKYDKTPLAAPLNTKFYFREEDFKRAMDILTVNDLMIVTGNAGIGKSRFAIEVSRKFCQEHPEYEPWAIYDRGVADLFEDFRVYFSRPGNYLIFVDDANRLSGSFEYILTLLKDEADDKHFKIVVTVRDYAIEKVRKQSEKHSSPFEITLKAFTGEQIRNLVREEFGITHHIWLERIEYISRGNPRIAVMAAKVAKEKTLEGISDVSALYDRYFGDVVAGIGLTSDPDLLRAAGIVSFFRTLDFSHLQLLSAISDAFGINPRVLKTACEKLHAHEILDMYENEVVKFSDQVLSTYIFYLAFFKQSILDLAALLSHFFPNYKERVIDSINPVINSFDFDAIIRSLRPQVTRLWNTLLASGDERGLLELMKVFWFVKQTDTLSYIHEKISALENISVDLPVAKSRSQVYAESDSLLGVLEAFANAEMDMFKIAVDLVLEYAEKRQNEFHKIIHTMVDPFGFKHFSYLQNYERQQYVVDALWKRCEDGNEEILSLLFIELAKTYLNTEFHPASMKEGNQVVIYNVKISASEPISKLRRKLFKGLFAFYDKPTLHDASRKAIEEYFRSAAPMADKRILEKDSKDLVPFIKTSFDPANLAQCNVAQDYFDLLEEKNIVVDPDVRKIFRVESHAAVELVRENHVEMAKLNIGLDEYERRKKEKITAHFSNYSFEDLMNFLADYSKALEEAKNTHKEWEFRKGIDDFFESLANRSSELYVKVVKEYLSRQDPIRLNHYPIVQHLLNICGREETLRILQEPQPKMNRWLFAYYYFLAKGEITKGDDEELLKLYAESEVANYPFDWNFLLKYREVDPEVFSQVGKILDEKISTDKAFARPLGMLFNGNLEVSKDICGLFAGNIDLLKKLYFAYLETEQYADYNGATFNQLLKNDQHFIIEYVDWMFGRKEWLSSYDEPRDYTFIWMSNNYINVMTLLMEHLFEKGIKQHFFSSGYEEAFFKTQNDRNKNPEISQRQDELLKKLIQKRTGEKEFIRFIFGIVANLSPERRAALTGFLLKIDSSFDIFESLPIEPTSWTAWGSMVPVLQSRIDYLQSLLPMMNTVDFLKHRQLIEHRIDFLREQIEEEKKRDFEEP